MRINNLLFRGMLHSPKYKLIFSYIVIIMAERKIHHPLGELNGSSILTDANVLEIRRKFAMEKYSMTKLSKEYKVCHTAISNVIHRKTWAHIPPEVSQ